MINQLRRQRLRGPMDRRRFLQGAGLGLTGAGVSLLFGCGGDDDDAPPADGPEPPPEVTTIRICRCYISCTIPHVVARRFLLEEGFTNVEYVINDGRPARTNEMLADRTLDMSMNFAPPVVFGLDRGLPLVVLGGLHPACFELRAGPGIASLADLRGKRVTIMDRNPQPADFAFATSILQHIGLTPGRDLELVAEGVRGLPTANRVLTEGVAHALFVNPPHTQQLRDASVGHVVLDSMTDRPWSQYFCCLLTSSKAFVEAAPVAAKRAVRAFVRASDYCATNPEAAAREYTDAGWSATYPYALETAQMLPYGAWRTHSVEDTMRFYALRLREAGVIESTPDEILKKGVDLRFFNEHKQKLALAPGFATRDGLFALNCEVTAGIDPLRPS